MAELETIEHRVEAGNSIVELKRRGEAYEVWVDGKRRLATDSHGGEDSFVDLALAPLRDRDDITVVLGGLGMGFTLQQLLKHPGVKRVDVVERSAAMLDWEKQYFAGLNGDAVRDERVHVHGGGVLEFVEKPREAGMPPEGFMAIVLDTDDAVGELWHPDNAALYTEDGLLRLERALRAGGVLATKVNGRDLELQARLVGLFQNVAEVCIPVELPDTMQLHYVYRGRRPPNTDPNKPKN